MAIPDMQSILLPLLELAGDNHIHRVRDAVDLWPSAFVSRTTRGASAFPMVRDRGFTTVSLLRARTSGKLACWRIPSAAGFASRGQADAFSRAGLHESTASFCGSSMSPTAPVVDGETPPPAEPAVTPEEALQDAYETLRSSLAEELLEQVMQSSPAFFELLVVDVLVRMGYGGSRKDAGEAIGQAGDEGIDGIIKEDRLGLDIIYI